MCSTRDKQEHRGDWWVVEEFAEITRRTPAAVRASIARGELPALKIGRRFFIDRAHFTERFKDAARACEKGRRN